VIGYRRIHGELKVVLVQRKDSVGFIDFVRGKYDPHFKKEEILKILIGEMTISEKKRLLELSFDELWNELWMNKNSRIFKNEYRNAKKKFELLDIKNMITESLVETKWNDTEFSIPKGRRNNFEHPVECSIREFTEETGIDRRFISLKKIAPLEEIFFGSNGIAYKHVYYLAEIFTEHIPLIDLSNILQAGEVKYINWYNCHQAVNIFRSYDSTKRTVILNAFKIIKSISNST
jgi:8-oxo-dGTP pyrophosphatase MutT (NUDIX family)